MCRDPDQLNKDYNFYLALGYSEYEAREATFGNEWDTPADRAYRESLFTPNTNKED